MKRRYPIITIGWAEIGETQQDTNKAQSDNLAALVSGLESANDPKEAMQLLFELRRLTMGADAYVLTALYDQGLLGALR